MSRRARFPEFGRRRLLGLLGLLFLALAAPTALLVREAYLQLKWESFHQHRTMAEELSARVDARLARLIATEEARSFAEYTFLMVAGDPSANFLQRSPLSEFPPKSGPPGVLGWFQLDAQGLFTTPLLPANPGGFHGIPPAELRQRLALRARLGDILDRNRLVRLRKEEKDSRSEAENRNLPAPAAARADAGPPATVADDGGRDQAVPATTETEAPAQAAFDELSQGGQARKLKRDAANTLGKVEDLKLGSGFPAEAEREVPSPRAKQAPRGEARAGRKEWSALPESAAPGAGASRPALVQTPLPLRVATFESEIDPLEFARLDSGDFVLFRKVWRDGQRYIQGLLIESAPFLGGLVESEFRATTLSRMSQLAVAHQGEVLAVYAGAADREYLGSARAMRGDLLHRVRLAAPLDGVELIYTITRLPAGPGGAVVAWLAAILAVVLCGGFYLLYRLGLGQIALARQQRDFISAVSHELKTPLTSIRMYGEMLKSGWVPEDKKPTYYDYIHSESERLSRLIANVLQLARLSRNGLELAPRVMRVAELLDIVRSKISTQVERAGFELSLRAEPEALESRLPVDPDAFAQIAINLVDNALKFSARSPRRAVEIGFRRRRDGTLVFAVRDHGPGVPRDQMKKIFRLFYRVDNALTRESVGTGIGLALVHSLARAMAARVDVVNVEPGAEFRVTFPGGTQASRP